MDNVVYLQLRAWARRHHPEKNQHWIAHKYWLIVTSEGWAFASWTGQNPIRLFNHAQTPIQRHVKVQGKRSPCDGDWIYWSHKMGHHPTVTSTIARLLNRQGGQCAHHGLYFFPDDRMGVHHRDKNPDHHRRDHLALLHRHCHDQLHAECV
jgi:RNA-directed DNA polymerase